MDFKYNKKYGKSQENIHESVYGPYMLRTLNWKSEKIPSYPE